MEIRGTGEASRGIFSSQASRGDLSRHRVGGTSERERERESGRNGREKERERTQAAKEAAREGGGLKRPISARWYLVTLAEVNGPGPSSWLSLVVRSRNTKFPPTSNVSPSLAYLRTNDITIIASQAIIIGMCSMCIEGLAGQAA